MHTFEFPLEHSKMQRWRKREIGGELAVIMEFPALFVFQKQAAGQAWSLNEGSSSFMPLCSSTKTSMGVLSQSVLSPKTLGGRARVAGGKGFAVQ